MLIYPTIRNYKIWTPFNQQTSLKAAIGIILLQNQCNNKVSWYSIIYSHYKFIRLLRLLEPDPKAAALSGVHSTYQYML